MGKKANWKGFEHARKLIDKNPKLSEGPTGDNILKLLNIEDCGRELASIEEFILCGALLDRNIKSIFSSEAAIRYKKEVEYIADNLLLVTLVDERNFENRINYSILCKDKKVIIYPMEGNVVFSRNYIEVYL